MAKVTDHTRTSVWQDSTDAERHLRYYISLAGKYRRRHHIVRAALLGAVLAEAGVVAPLAIRYPGVLAAAAVIGVGLVVIALTVFDATSDDAKNSAKLTVASEDSQLINTEWRSLWSDIETDQIEESEARRRQREILDRTNVVSARVEVNLDVQRNARYGDEAKEIMKGRYAQTT